MCNRFSYSAKVCGVWCVGCVVWGVGCVVEVGCVEEMGLVRGVNGSYVRELTFYNMANIKL